MKKTILYITLISIFSVILFHSCEDEDTIRFNIKDFEQGFLPFFGITENSASSFDPSDLANASVTIVVDLRAQETEKLASPATEVSSIVVIGTFDNLLFPLDAPDTAVIATITQWPKEITLTPQDMVDAFDSLSSINDMQGGDVFNFSQQIILKDGRIIEGINHVNTIEVFDTAGQSLGDLRYRVYDNDLIINESGKNAYDLDLFVNCPANPDEIVGTYSSLSNGNFPDFGDFTDFEYTVTITETETSNFYTISDFSFGTYDHYYGAWYWGGDLPGTVMDLCGSYFIMNTLDPWGEVVSGNFTFNTDGTITVAGGTTFGEIWTAVLTKQ
jgi:hypothetical protein